MTERRASLVHRYQRVIGTRPMDFCATWGLPTPREVRTAAAWGDLGTVRQQRDRVDACDTPVLGLRAIQRIMRGIETDIADAEVKRIRRNMDAYAGPECGL